MILRTNINIFAIVVALVLGLSMRSRSDKPFLDYRLFMLMLVTVVFELVTDTVMWCLEGLPSWPGRAGLVAVSLLYYLGHPFASMFYSIYAINQVGDESKKLGTRLPILTIPALTSGVLSLASLFTGWFFYVDSSGYYRHGPLFPLFISLSYCYFAVAIAIVVAYWRRADRRTLAGLVVAPLFPTAASVAQLCSYGLVLIWPASVIALLVIYVNIQQRKLSRDYLTGAYNRRRLDEYLSARAKEVKDAAPIRPLAAVRRGSGRAGRSFAGFLADVDDFKSINDRLGHAAGDRALVETVRILQSCLRSEDFLARYAGDEFVAIFPFSDEEELAGIVARVRSRFDERNRRGGNCHLSLSVGAAVFDPGIDANADKFVERLDGLMYREKQSKKERRG